MSNFRILLQGDDVIAEIHTRSRPSQLIARLVAQLLVDPYQRSCTKQALVQMRDAILRAEK